VGGKKIAGAPSISPLKHEVPININIEISISYRKTINDMLETQIFGRPAVKGNCQLIDMTETGNEKGY
jgi:hypothetical protein